MTMARGLAAGRLAIGIGLIAAPTPCSRGWLGDVAEQPAGQVAMRALGIRDAILGALTLHTLSHPEVGPRWLATCAVADTVDFAATAAARKGLPPQAVGVIALAGGSAVAGFALSAVLKRAA